LPITAGNKRYLNWVGASVKRNKIGIRPSRRMMKQHKCALRSADFSPLRRRTCVSDVEFFSRVYIAPDEFQTSNSKGSGTESAGGWELRFAERSLEL